MDNPIKMDDLGVPLFLETSIYLLLSCSAISEHVKNKKPASNLAFFPMNIFANPPQNREY